MRPGDLLDAQRDLIERLGMEDFRTMIAAMVAQHASQVEGVGYELEEAMQRSKFAPDILRSTVKAAYPFKVTRDMCAMVRHAANMLDDTDQFDPSAAPTGCGIVYFEDPFRVEELRGRTMLLHWLAWGPAEVDLGSGPETVTMLWTFNDSWAQPDQVQQEHQQTLLAEHGRQYLEEVRHMTGRWATIAVDAPTNRMRVGPAQVTPGTEQARRVLSDGDQPHSTTNITRLVMATWMLMGQTVTHVADEQPDRAARRRAVRAKLPQQVTVIRLRREQAPPAEPGESHVEWSHRWITRGHWRWQPYGHGRSERRRIWIDPYVKGPADKPLVQSEKVYSLER